MRVELTEMIWLEQHEVSLGELIAMSGLPREVVEELLSTGAIAPLQSSGAEERFGSAALNAARRARRLREDFELDVHALPLALALLERIGELERELRALQARSPGRLR
jgi:chaperone modulatory protein CbpM